VSLRTITLASPLRRYIVEQQYSNAVAVVIRTRAYVENMTNLQGSKLNAAENAKALDILKEINQKSVLLASTIKKSLLNLPHSSVTCLTCKAGCKSSLNIIACLCDT
jgi:hypothetical protein